MKCTFFWSNRITANLYIITSLSVTRLYLGKVTWVVPIGKTSIDLPQNLLLIRASEKTQVTKIYYCCHDNNYATWPPDLARTGSLVMYSGRQRWEDGDWPVGEGVAREKKWEEERERKGQGKTLKDKRRLHVYTSEKDWSERRLNIKILHLRGLQFFFIWRFIVDILLLLDWKLNVILNLQLDSPAQRWT